MASPDRQTDRQGEVSPRSAGAESKAKAVRWRDGGGRASFFKVTVPESRQLSSGYPCATHPAVHTSERPHEKPGVPPFHSNYCPKPDRPASLARLPQEAPYWTLDRPALSEAPEADSPLPSLHALHALGKTEVLPLLSPQPGPASILASSCRPPLLPGASHRALLSFRALPPVLAPLTSPHAWLRLFLEGVEAEES